MGEETACYSRCDQNRHLNHARYADLVMDRVDTSLLEHGLPRHFCISYYLYVGIAHNRIDKPLLAYGSVASGQTELLKLLVA